MSFSRQAALIAAVAALAVALPPSAQARSYQDMALGQNREAQACHGVWRFEGAGAPSAVDVYCGAWDSPTGTARAVASADQAAAKLAETCAGASPLVSADPALIVRQVACRRADGDTGPARFGLIAVSPEGRAAYGTAFPADWAPLLAAARATLGETAGAAAAQSPPGLKEIEAVYPEGPPGQGAAFNYELLRRRGYEQNVAWSFGASERDFSELLRAHQKAAPDDKAGEAEILGEIGLNLSNGGRFQDAADLFDRAEAEAAGAGDRLLVSKIANYRAIDALNRGDNAAARRLALAANIERERTLGGAPKPGGGPRITGADAMQIEDRAAAQRQRAIVAALEDITPADKARVLSAQADEIAAVAARALGQADAGALLDRALAELSQSAAQPAWLAGQIYEERSTLALARGDAAAAAAEAAHGLRRVRELAPETRIEARLMLALERAEWAAGQRAEALATGRAAVTILERQSEAPGMPADVASGHIEALLSEYERTGDPALAREYFETLSLVWDGAASRAAAQLAARLGEGKGGDTVRAYQDAQRAYRAALSRRVRLSGAEATSEDLDKADKAADAAAKLMFAAENQVRAVSPRYLELLNPKVATGDLQAVLRPGEGYVRVVLAKAGGYGAVVTRDGVTPYRIALGAGEADRLVTGLRTSAVIRGRRLPDFDILAARKLYRAMFEPVAAIISPLRTLHLDGGGVLAALPAGALIVSDIDDAHLQQIALDQDYSGVDWFARHHALDTALGPAAFVRTRQAGGAAPIPNVVAFGDFRPDPARAAAQIAAAHGLSERCRAEVQRALTGLQALPETATEARDAAAAFGADGHATLGAAFTDDDFFKASDVANAQVLVLATHGVLGLSTCFAEPALLTSVGPQGDGLIEASQLLDRSLKARLVVLSACDTAGGGHVTGAALTDGGEALSGLARAFIYAGAPSVLATEWKIDASASALQTDVLLRTAARDGRTVAEALNAAQASLYDNAETAHPFYWSGFVLIGDGGAKLVGPGA
ncbi:CHAT domain-containing protein [Caulobacter sp. KR2-114]|uniref:CHAT domain-containing protein n=1 Tax=Caulobacter sp. KR2-114 TaxID=3400912 RepID=UPI003C086036